MTTRTLVLLLLAATPTLAVDKWTRQFGGATSDLAFTGVNTFAHLPHSRCLDDPEQKFDVAIFGMPFDSAVSFRPGARFGPHAIRSGSRRQMTARGWSSTMEINPYTSGFSILDCGDAPITPYDQGIAIRQVNAAYDSLLSREVESPMALRSMGMATGLDGKLHPRIISLGGDHTIVLPILEALNDVYGPVSVIHFDAHIDTWNPARYPGAPKDDPKFKLAMDKGYIKPNHGTFFWHAYEKGYIKANSSIHAGIRTRFSGPEDLDDDVTAGFALIHTYDIDDIGVAGIAKKIRERIGSGPVYVSLDIDVADPSTAPATGTPESGGWSARELRRLVQQALVGLNIVGMDIVEVSPAYDDKGETTGILAADLVYDFLTVLAKGPDPPAGEVDMGQFVMQEL